MTPQKIVAIAARLFAVWLGLSGMLTAIITLAKWGGVDWMIGIGLLLYFLLCIFIWMFPLTIANKIVPRMPEQSGASLTGLSFAQAAISIMGLWFLASGLIAITSSVVSNAHYFFSANSNFQSLPIEWKVFIGTKFVAVVAGGILMSNSRRIAAACMENPQISNTQISAQ